MWYAETVDELSGLLDLLTRSTLSPHGFSLEGRVSWSLPRFRLIQKRKFASPQ
jgi:hypothetical protein